MWLGRSVEDTAILFRSAFPERGEAIDLAAGDTLLRTEADAARKISALYWPRDFAGSFGFEFECVVYHS